MLTIRFKNSTNLQTNLQGILTLIADPKCAAIHLFASPSLSTPDHRVPTDGATTNLTLVSALAKYEIPGITDVYVLFDGLFLSAASQQRVREIQAMLNQAEVSGKATFAAVSARFTSSMSTQDAVDHLLSLAPTVVLTNASRAQYFNLLSSVPEHLH